MKRKIAVVVAADIAGYSTLVADDEEETLRRLGSYRSVVDDFVTKSSGRIFNTAGDAVLAEFPSAVEAVRCAINVQESLRTRNLAYPKSREMSFRIGITIGDVVERDGDLLGDGVNIAARLEGLANPGGICISRAIYELVANKLSVQFKDIGEQQVKNILTPIHAFMLQLQAEDPPQTTSLPNFKTSASWQWPAAISDVNIYPYLVSRGPAAHQAFIARPNEPWDKTIRGSETVEDLRAKLVAEPLELRQPIDIKVRGTLFPCALLSSGWWDRRSQGVNGYQDPRIDGCRGRSTHAWSA